MRRNGVVMTERWIFGLRVCALRDYSCRAAELLRLFEHGIGIVLAMRLSTP